jgi:branched-chain amino acid transport system permease protein
MMGLLGSAAAVGYQRIVIDIAMFFGLFFIVAMALNFQYGNAGVPNMACALSASIGAYTVSAIVTRLIYWIGKQAGLDILPLASKSDWINHNNCMNAEMMSDYIQAHAFLGITMLLFSLALGFAAGWALGYVISLPAIRLRSTYLIIALIMMTDISHILMRIIVPISGGANGMFVPNVLAWYPGDRTILMAVVTLIIGFACYLLLRRMLNSPYGRLMRAVRGNTVTVNSFGKDSTAIRRNVLMFGSGVTALSGVLLSYYYSFVIDSNFSTPTWTYWPWMMIMIGGPGNYAGTFLGCALIIAVWRLMMLSKWHLARFVWYPIVIFEQQIMVLLFLVILILRPKGLIPEKPLRIAGINYRRLMTEESARSIQ